jgi:hypothetical protein
VEKSISLSKAPNIFHVFYLLSVLPRANVTRVVRISFRLARLGSCTFTASRNLGRFCKVSRSKMPLLCQLACSCEFTLRYDLLLTKKATRIQAPSILHAQQAKTRLAASHFRYLELSFTLVTSLHATAVSNNDSRYYAICKTKGQCELFPNTWPFVYSAAEYFANVLDSGSVRIYAFGHCHGTGLRE